MASKFDVSFTQQAFTDDFSPEKPRQQQNFWMKLNCTSHIINSEFVLKFVRLIEALRTMTSFACGHQGCLLDILDTLICALRAQYSSQESYDAPSYYVLSLNDVSSELFSVVIIELRLAPPNAIILVI